MRPSLRQTKRSDGKSVAFDEDTNFYEEAVKLWVRQVALNKLIKYSGSKKKLEELMDELNQELIERLRAIAQPTFNKLVDELSERMKAIDD